MTVPSPPDSPDEPKSGAASPGASPADSSGSSLESRPELTKDAAMEAAEESLPDPNSSIEEAPRSALWHVVILIILLGVFGAILGAFTGEKVTFLYKEVLHLTPSDIGTLALVLGIPAYLQPFVGAWVDIVPFVGYHRRSYYLAGKLLSVVGIGLLAVTHQYRLIPVACLLFLNAAGGTIRSVIINAFTVSVGNITGTFGRLLALGSLIPIVMSIAYTAHLAGYVTQHWSYQRAFGAAAVLSLALAVLVLLIDENKVVRTKQAVETPEEAAERQMEKEAERTRTVQALKQGLRSPGMWALVAFVFYLIITPGIYTAQIYFMTDVLHISKQTIGDLGRWNGIGALVAIALFGLFSRRLPVWTMVWGAWLMDCLSYPMLLLLHDANSAKWLALVAGTVGLLYGFCLNTLAARVCPPGLEGTIYALFTAAIALAGALSEKFGGWLYVFFGPDNKAHHYSIQHGWTTSLLIGLAFTVAGAVFIPFLPAWTRSRLPMKDVKPGEN